MDQQRLHGKVQLNARVAPLTVPPTSDFIDLIDHVTGHLWRPSIEISLNLRDARPGPKTGRNAQPTCESPAANSARVSQNISITGPFASLPAKRDLNTCRLLPSYLRDYARRQHGRGRAQWCRGEAVSRPVRQARSPPCALHSAQRSMSQDAVGQRQWATRTETAGLRSAALVRDLLSPALGEADLVWCPELVRHSRRPAGVQTEAWLRVLEVSAAKFYGAPSPRCSFRRWNSG